MAAPLEGYFMVMSGDCVAHASSVKELKGSTEGVDDIQHLLIPLLLGRLGDRVVTKRSIICPALLRH